MYRIQIRFGEQVITAELDNTPSTQDFIKQLPMTLDFEDYGATEKIAYPHAKLSTQDAPEGVTPVTGDIAYYSPWGNLALFYRDFSYSKDLIRLGRITSGLEHLQQLDSSQATLELISNE